MAKTKYVASLLHLQAAGRAFCEAFRGAAAAANAFDPEGKVHEPLAAETMLDLSAQLRAVCAFVPGARECLAIALAGELEPKE